MGVASRETKPKLLGDPVGTRLFLDNRLVEEQDNLAPFIAPCCKHPANPLTVDGRTVWTQLNLTCSVYYDALAGEYRGWRYERAPDARDDAGGYYPIASPDGLAWQTTGGPTIGQAILHEPDEPDPSRRYKMVYQGWARLGLNGEITEPVCTQPAPEAHGDPETPTRGIFAACSQDGAEWSDHRLIAPEKLTGPYRWWKPGTLGWAGGDSFPCVIHAPELGKYVAFYRTNIYRGRKRRERAVGRSDSPDFRTWGRHDLALHAQTSWHRAMGRQNQDFYQMQVWRCGGVYLGIVSVFYWQEDRNHLELAWSPDTIHWERICPGQDLVPHGELGEHDGGCRYAAMRPILDGDRVRVYYGGSTGRHNADRVGDSALCLATFRRDRFSGLAPARGHRGSLLTTPLRVESAALTLNADARGGEVLVEVCDESGQALDGFAAEDCVGLRDTDALAGRVSWREGRDLRTLVCRNVRLRVILRNAEAYALSLQEISR